MVGEELPVVVWAASRPVVVAGLVLRPGSEKETLPPRRPAGNDQRRETIKGWLVEPGCASLHCMPLSMPAPRRQGNNALLPAAPLQTRTRCLLEQCPKDVTSKPPTCSLGTKQSFLGLLSLLLLLCHKHVSQELGRLCCHWLLSRQQRHAQDQLPYRPLTPRDSSCLCTRTPTAAGACKCFTPTGTPGEAAEVACEA